MQSSRSGSGTTGEEEPPAEEPGDADAPAQQREPPPRRGLLPFPLKHLGNARQVIIVTSRSWAGTQARLEAYEDGEHGWVRRVGPVDARVGRTGMIDADRRVQGSGTTPAGTFPLTMAFGTEPDPGTGLPYTYVTSPDHWWVTDPVSAHYNTLRLAESGGFHLSESGRRGSERILAHPDEYAHAVVIDFNRPYPDRGRGAGIFIRVGIGLSTDGSVAVDREVLRALLRWLDPALHPVVTIAPERSIIRY